MRVLLFRHVPFEGAGHLETVLRRRGIPFDYADLYECSAPAPHPENYDALVLLGGPMSANDPLPYLQFEAECIRRAVAEGVPLLGICLGAQLIARTLGAAVKSNGAREIGWFEVRFTQEAAGDPLFAGLGPETLFHWHGETFDLPPGAELLASSDLCRNQAYRIGDRIYGLQFHLEVTPGMIADWCTQDANCGDVSELTSPVDPHYNAGRMAELSERVLGAWCDRIRGLPTGKGAGEFAG